MSLRTQNVPDNNTACHDWWFGAWDKVVNGVVSCYGFTPIDVPAGYIAIDTHVHSMFSGCSVSSPEQIILRAVKIGLSGIAILDHNNVEGGKYAEVCCQNLKKEKLIPENFLVIPGVEINSSAGHVGALFIDKEIPRRLSLLDTVQQIHDAGGLAVAVHPYRPTGIGDALFDAPFDAVEVESGSVFRRSGLRRTSRLLEDERLKNVAKLGASDAHFVRTVGNCYTLVKTEEITPEAVRSAFMNGQSIASSSESCHKLRKLLGVVSLPGR